jgi:acetyl-CoA carboxylase biotin carboxylase subunit
VDNGVYQGFEIPLEYDPVLAKLICWGRDREEAIERTQRALSEYRVSGPKTNLYFHQRALEVDDFVKGRYDTHFVDQHLAKILEVSREDKTLALMASAVAKFLGEGKKTPAREGTVVQDASVWRLSGRREGLRR